MPRNLASGGLPRSVFLALRRGPQGLLVTLPGDGVWTDELARDADQVALSLLPSPIVGGWSEDGRARLYHSVGPSLAEVLEDDQPQ